MTDTPTQSCPAPPIAEDQKVDAAEILASLGGNHVCDQAAQSALSTWSADFQAEMHANAPLVSAGGSMGLSMGSSDSKNNSHSSGCGSVTSNLIDQSFNKANMLCNFSSNISDTVVGGVGKNTITFRQLPPTDSMRQQNTDIVRLLVASLPPPYHANGKTSRAELKMIKEMHDDAWNELQKTIRGITGGIDLKEVTFTQEITGEMHVTGNLTETVTNQLKSQMTTSVTSTAAAHIQKVSELGAAVTAPIKSNIAQYVTGRDEDITNMLQSALNKVQLQESGTNSVDVLFYGEFHMKNVKFDQFVQQRLQVDEIMKSSRTLGKMMASDIMSILSTKSTMEIEEKGLSDLQKTIADGRAKIAAANKRTAQAGGGAMMMLFAAFMLFQGGGSKMLVFLLVAIGLFIAAAWYFKFFPFSKDEKED